MPGVVPPGPSAETADPPRPVRRRHTGAVPLHARRLLSSMSVVVATVVVVVGAARAARTDRPQQPAAPAARTSHRCRRPRSRTAAVGSRNWTAITCPGHGLGCRVPTCSTSGGARFQHGRSHRQDVEQREPSSRTLSVRVSPNGGRRWVLVGADGSSSASELSIRFSDRVAAVIPSGTLTLLSVPGKSRPAEVTVSDYGRSGADEVLRIEEYDALD